MVNNVEDDPISTKFQGYASVLQRKQGSPGCVAQRQRAAQEITSPDQQVHTLRIGFRQP